MGLFWKVQSVGNRSIDKCSTISLVKKILFPLGVTIRANLNRITCQKIGRPGQPTFHGLTLLARPAI